MSKQNKNESRSYVDGAYINNNSLPEIVVIKKFENKNAPKKA